MIGIIYKYTDPKGVSYIGQTLDECRRQKEFMDLNVSYSGKKINEGRLKYGPENFKYEVLEKCKYETLEEALIDLNNKESYYIGKYDTYENGYNMTLGGEGVRGIIFTEEIKRKISHTLKEYHKTHDNPFKGKKHSEKTKQYLREIAIGRPSPWKGRKWSKEQRIAQSERAKQYTKGIMNGFYGKKHSEKTKEIISESNSKPVLQIDIKTNKVIKRFKSTKEAGLSLGKVRGNSEIIKVCKGYVSPSNKHYKTAFGYKWKYDFDGSTTTETV